jgi:hypothetical protein
VGLIPLVWAHGAAMLSRRAVGTAVFAGMIVATCIGVFLIPMLYVVFQTWRERGKQFLARTRSPKRRHAHGDNEIRPRATDPAGRGPETP